MSKNIIILCDGTSNTISTDRTNILRLFGTLKKDETQLVYYDPGVGTFGADSSASYYYRKSVEIWGLATGWGLDQNVLEAYQFIAKHYNHGSSTGSKKTKPDNIYLFGFSRGAYTARVLAGFIRAVGIIPGDNINLLNYAYRAYKNIGINDDDESEDAAFAEVNLYERMLSPIRPSIKLLGLFDTVGSVIESGRYGPRMRTHAFTRNNSCVENVRHAIAIDEKRTMFEPQLWAKSGQYRSNIFNSKSAIEQNINEVWFSGVHCDVGGGYPETDSGLAKIPLSWMIDECKPLGLKFTTQTINSIVLGKHKNKPYVQPDPHADKNESMNWGWKVLEFLPRKKTIFNDAGKKVSSNWSIPLSSPRKIPDGANIHKSVVERYTKNSEEKPINLPKAFITTS